MRHLLWWFRYRLLPRYQYHLLYTGLPPRYHDLDRRILYGVMEGVRTFLAESHTDWTGMPETRADWCLLTETMAWWERYKVWDQEEERKPEIVHTVAEEQRWEDEADARLLALMQIRQHLWD